MANNGSYSNERPSISGGEIDYATDPASGGFFISDYKKKKSKLASVGHAGMSLLRSLPGSGGLHSGSNPRLGNDEGSSFVRHDDLKQMLDANKDGLKLEAMKRIIGMVAKGRDASELFPAVVKNVVSKNIEVKKLVYVYLVRYAEEQQDLALLSISTFQRALKDPNQLIRASALRVLSSIRVPVIVPIVMLAIKDSASDMSPYVRKTAAHAIPKLYSLDPEQKDELVHLIDKLLSDKTTLVVGSAVMAFEEVCPERIDLIHKNFRKLCNLLVDVDEWGQVVIINMLTRYARTQFVDPNKYDAGEDDDENRPFYDDDDIDEGKESKVKKPTVSLDPDYRLLLKNAKPLLQSRNASVVMAVAQLHHHLAPRGEVAVIAKSLVRLLRSHREVQSVVLNCIASVSTHRKGMFEPYLKSFFVRTSDATHIKLLKLEILTNLATETSISVILREFQTYISSPDKEFVAAAIQAIGRCASNIKEVTDSCLTGLVAMLSNRDEAVVAESVVVIKKLLQSQPSRHRDIIRSMARLMDTITVPAARASILWLLGEYSELVPTIAPDVLRKMAKSFINEEDIVKLQVLNLAVKLVLNNPGQTRLLCQYVFSLARYDQNYDIRDRSRFLRQFVFPANGDNKLSSHAKKIFLATKPAPLLQSKFINREPYQMGSLSHYLNTRAFGYHDLPPFPDEAPDSTARIVSPPSPPLQADITFEKKPSKVKSFYEESDSSPADESDSSEGESSKDDDEEEGEESGEDGSDEESNDSESSSETESEPTPTPQAPIGVDNAKKRSTIVASESDDSTEISSSDEGSDSEGESSGEKTPVKKQPPPKNKPSKPQSNLDLLLDLDDIAPSTPIMTPSLGGFLTPLSPMSTQERNVVDSVQLVSPSFVPLKRFEVLNKVSGSGLSIEARFTRQPHLYSPKMTTVELTFTNNSPKENFTDIKVSSKKVMQLSGLTMHDFAPISILAAGGTAVGTLGVDWNDSTQPLTFEVGWAEAPAGVGVTIRPPIGELVRAVAMPHSMFITEQGKLKGMNEHMVKFMLAGVRATLPQRVYEVTNMSLLPAVEPLIYRFCGQTLSSKSLVLLTIKFESMESNNIEVSANCEKLVIGSMLLNDIKSALKS